MLLPIPICLMTGEETIFPWGNYIKEVRASPCSESSVACRACGWAGGGRFWEQAVCCPLAAVCCLVALPGWCGRMRPSQQGRASRIVCSVQISTASDPIGLRLHLLCENSLRLLQKQAAFTLAKVLLVGWHLQSSVFLSLETYIFFSLHSEIEGQYTILFWLLPITV